MVWQLTQTPVTLADRGNGKLIRTTAEKITEKINCMLPVNLLQLITISFIKDYYQSFNPWLYGR
jgi:hypothetical protein